MPRGARKAKTCRWTRSWPGWPGSTGRPSAGSVMRSSPGASRCCSTTWFRFARRSAASCGTSPSKPAGTLYQPVACDLMSISPKLSLSTPTPRESPTWAVRHESARHVPEVMRRLMAEYDYQLKFVVQRPEDCREVEAYLAEFPDVDRGRVWLMPQGVNAGSWPSGHAGWSRIVPRPGCDSAPVGRSSGSARRRSVRGIGMGIRDWKEAMTHGSSRANPQSLTRATPATQGIKDWGLGIGKLDSTPNPFRTSTCDHTKHALLVPQPSTLIPNP